MSARAILDKATRIKPGRRALSVPHTALNERPAASAAEQLKTDLLQRTACVGVIGLGYVGLPLACIYHDRGFRVLGFDIDSDVRPSHGGWDAGADQIGPTDSEDSFDDRTVLDNFNRANGSLGASWTKISDGGLAVASQAVAGTASAGDLPSILTP